MGVVVLLVAIVFMRVKLPEIEHQTEVDSQGHHVGLWSHKLFIFGLIALFAYEVSEISINSFFINYVVEQGWMNARRASLILSFGGLSLFMAGRFIGSWIMQRISAERRVSVINKGGTILPFSLSLRGLGSHTKRASSFLMMSPVGGVVGPLLMGYVADITSSMVMSFIVPWIAYAVVLMYACRIVFGKVRS